MSILITGANGAVGLDLVKNLSKKFNVYAIYRKKKSKVKNVFWIKHNLNKKIKINFKKPLKCIVHCAVDQKYLNINDKNYIQSNFKIIQNLINIAEKNKSRLFVNFSSMEVYGTQNSKILKEDDKILKTNVYGYMKLICEKYLKERKINFINLRLPGILTKSSQDLRRPWLNNVLRKLKKNEDIIIFNSKKKFNNVINTDEISKLILFLIKKNKKVNDTFNFSAKLPQKLSIILSLLKNQMKSKSKIIQIKDKKKKSFYISTTKIEKKLRFRLMNTKEIIKKSCEKFN